MPYLVNSTVNSQYAERKWLRFPDEENNLKIRFVQAHTRTIQVETNRISLFRLLTNTVTRDLPDVISFSPNLALKKILGRINSQIEVYEIPDGSFANTPGYFAIPATAATVFFIGIGILQKETDPFFITAPDLQACLEALSAHKYITAEEQPSIAMNISTEMTEACYADETKKTQDVKRAINLAWYNRDLKEFNDAFLWLRRAQKYLGNDDLTKHLNLEKFFKKFKCLTRTIHFESKYSGKFLEVLARSPNLKRLAFTPYAAYDIATTSKIAEFLVHSKYVESLDLSSVWTVKNYPVQRILTNATFAPIAEAFAVNTSIRYLNIADTYVGDEGVRKLIAAIQGNPDSPIKRVITASSLVSVDVQSELNALIESRKGKDPA